MQSLLLPAPWFSKSHFGPHRFDIDPGRGSLPLRPPSPVPKPSLRASYLAHPMSSNLPPDTQAESAITTQRDQERRQTESKSSAAAAAATAAAATLSSLPPRLPTLIPVEGPSVSHASRFLSTEEARSSSSATQVPGIPSTVSLSQVVLASPPQIHGLSTTARTLPPRSTRRAKAHVASACVNCKKKHLGCDSARPCRRCVSSGKAATCVDVTHKKRGRPPLRAEEASLRAVPSLESSISSRDLYHTAPGRRLGHSKTSSREIRPITDLQYSRPPEYSANPLAASSGRWQPFTSPQVLSGTHGQRPVSSPGPPPGVSFSPSPYIPFHGATFSPPGSASDMLPAVSYSDRPPAVTTPTVSPQQYQHHFPPSLQSHISPQTPSRGLESSGSWLGFRDPLTDSGVRLPPILPSPPTFVPHASSSTIYSHRRGESYPSVATYQSFGSSQLEHSPPTSHVHESPRSASALEPSLSIRREPFPSIPAPRNRMPSGSDERRPPHQLQQQQPSRSQSQSQSQLQSHLRGAVDPPYEQRRRRSEPEHDENPQPVKRRRMAVDDIVND